MDTIPHFSPDGQIIQLEARCGRASGPGQSPERAKSLVLLRGTERTRKLRGLREPSAKVGIVVIPPARYGRRKSQIRYFRC